MSVSEQACQCGCSTMTEVTRAAEPCSCGCECCATTAKSTEAEVAELQQLRQSVDRRLAELGQS
jgi:hypothetical protein